MNKSPRSVSNYPPTTDDQRLDPGLVLFGFDLVAGEGEVGGGLVLQLCNPVTELCHRDMSLNSNKASLTLSLSHMIHGSPDL